MSSWYKVKVEVSEHDPLKEDAIQEAVRGYMSIDDCQSYSDTRGCQVIEFISETNIGDVELFAEDVTREVWKAHGDYCSVLVSTVNIEDLPWCVASTLTQDDYDRENPKEPAKKGKKRAKSKRD